MRSPTNQTYTIYFHQSLRSSSRPSRCGMTVLEVLVAATLALIMIIAMVEIFGRAGDAVTKGRASLELAGQLRLAAYRLEQDLQGVTVATHVWQSTDQGQGYLEIVEGGRSYTNYHFGTSRDRDADGDGTLDIQEDADGNGVFDVLEGHTEFGADSSIGDIDDAIMFTARSRDTPYVGQIRATIYDSTATSPATIDTIESSVAEVAWWTTTNFPEDRNVDGSFDRDLNSNNFWDQGENIDVTLHRRALLIRPDLNVPHPTDPDIKIIVDGQVWVRSGGSIVAGAVSPTPRQLRLFYNENDLSVRPQFDSTGTVVGWVANSLADLAKRENRFAHYPVPVDPATDIVDPALHPEYTFADPTAPANSLLFPFQVDNNKVGAAVGASRAENPLSLRNLTKWDVEKGVDGQWGVASTDDDLASPPDPSNPPPPLVDDPREAGFGDDVVQNRLGEDVILSNLRAFDIRVFDPQAPIGAALNARVAIVPGDVGYAPATTTIGTGAFVDLGHEGTTGLFRGELITNPLFNESFRKSQLSDPTYCTWSWHYEHDTVDQDLNLTPPDPLGLNQGTNGYDDDNVNGVDDPGERETSPPFATALRGIKVVIRVIEPRHTKQVRQTSVVSNFTPE